MNDFVALQEINFSVRFLALILKMKKKHMRRIQEKLLISG